MTNFFKLFSIIGTLTVAGLSFIPVRHSETSTLLFCAYGQVFVEFNEDNHKWGTLWLDRHGRPIPCKEDQPVVENYLRGNYNESI